MSETRIVGPNIPEIADTMTRQVRMRGWQRHHSIYLLSLHSIDRDALVDALPLDVLEAMATYREEDR